MTTRPTEPHAMSRRRSSLPWMIAGAVVVTLVLTSCSDDSGDQSAAATSTPTSSGKQGYDLSTPEAAAESFAAVAETGSGDKLLELACVGHPDCVREHAAGVGEAQVTEAQDAIREGVFELSVHLKGAEFAAAVDGDESGVKEVPYRTPEMTGDAYLTLTFVQFDGDWLYYRPAT